MVAIHEQNPVNLDIFEDIIPNSERVEMKNLEVRPNEPWKIKTEILHR